MGRGFGTEVAAVARTRPIRSLAAALSAAPSPTSSPGPLANTAAVKRFTAYILDEAAIPTPDGQAVLPNGRRLEQLFAEAFDGRQTRYEAHDVVLPGRGGVSMKSWRPTSGNPVVMRASAELRHELRRLGSGSGRGRAKRAAELVARHLADKHKASLECHDIDPKRSHCVFLRHHGSEVKIWDEPFPHLNPERWVWQLSPEGTLTGRDEAGRPVWEVYPNHGQIKRAATPPPDAVVLSLPPPLTRAEFTTALAAVR